MKYIAFISILMLFSFGVFANGSFGPMPQEQQEQTEFYSFENDFEGWTATGMDLDHAGGFIPWSITRSQDIAKDGNTSLKLFLFNINDGGKIYIEKPFTVEPNQLYQAKVEYAFGSRDYGTANLFTIVTGVLNKQPQSGGDLVPVMKDLTGNDAGRDVGYKWLNKEYDFTVQSGDGTLYILIGVWGTYEAPRTYYLDNVRVTFTKKEEGSEFYSFENDLEGWTANGTDLELGSDVIDWSITPTQEIWEDGTASVKFDLNNGNGKGKIWIEKPFLVEPKKKYKVTIDYSFASRFWSRPRFKIITGILREHPVTSDDLMPAFQGDADNEDHWGWLHKSYKFTVKSKKNGALYVVIGIWGTEQAQRIYFFDNVCITLTRK